MLKVYRMKKWIVFFILLFNIFLVNAQKVTEKSDIARSPWMSGEYPETNGTYTFKVISDIEGSSVSEAKENAFTGFLIDYANSRGIIVSSKTLKEMKSEYTDKYEETDKTTHTFNIKREDFQVSFELLDSYWEKSNDGNYKLWALYAVEKKGFKLVSEPIEYTNGYGFSAVWRSALVPGWGQLYKKQQKKGAFMLATTGVLVGGFLVSQLNFAKNYDKAMEYRGVNNEYYTTYKANYEDWNKVRTFFGIGYGLYYVFNIIDVLRPNGAKRYVPKNSNLAIIPNINSNYCSLTLKLNLK